MSQLVVLSTKLPLVFVHPSQCPFIQIIYTVVAILPFVLIGSCQTALQDPYLPSFCVSFQSSDRVDCVGVFSDTILNPGFTIPPSTLVTAEWVETRSSSRVARRIRQFFLPDGCLVRAPGRRIRVPGLSDRRRRSRKRPGKSFRP
jgi:hypothetical protein